MAEDHEKLAAELEREAAALEEKGRAVGKDIKETRDDWRRKVADSSVAGAAPPGDVEEAALGESGGAEEAGHPEDLPAAGP